MPFVVNPECKCCKDMLWHCKKCWERFHNGKVWNDYEPPKYFGQSMLSDEVIASLNEIGIKHNPKIKSDKNRRYREGEYH